MGNKHSKHEFKFDDDRQTQLLIEGYARKYQVEMVKVIAIIICAYSKCDATKTKDNTEQKTNTIASNIKQNEIQPTIKSVTNVNTTKVRQITHLAHIYIKVDDDGIWCHGTVIDQTRNTVLVGLDECCKEHYGNKCLIAWNKDIHFSNPFHDHNVWCDCKSKKVKPFQSTFDELDELLKLQDKEPQKLYEVLLIVGFIRDFDEEILAKLGNDVCMMFCAYYHRDKLSKIMEKYPNLNVFELSVIAGCHHTSHDTFDTSKGHFMFEITAKDDFDGHIKVISTNEAINEWLTEQLRVYVLKHINLNSSGQKMIVDIKDFAGRRLRMKMDRNVSRGGIGSILALFIGVPPQQIRIIYRGRLYSDFNQTLENIVASRPYADGRVPLIHTAIKLRG